MTTYETLQLTLHLTDTMVNAGLLIVSIMALLKNNR